MLSVTSSEGRGGRRTGEAQAAGSDEESALAKTPPEGGALAYVLARMAAIIGDFPFAVETLLGQPTPIALVSLGERRCICPPRSIRFPPF